MENKTLENMRYCVEPVHPMAVKLYSDLVTIYKFVKDNYQKDIDAAFDRASQQIGFVVTTTVPVMLEVGEGGAIKSLTMGAESLKNTPFEKEIIAVFDLKKKGENKINVSAGVYNLALFWYDAVKLKLRTDWMEPAHPVFQLQSELMGMRQSPQSAAAMNIAGQPQPWLEPVHFPGCRPWLEPVHTHTPWTEPVHHMPWMEPVHPHTPWMEPVHYPGCRPWLEPAHPVFQTAADFQTAVEAKKFEHTEPVQYLNRVSQIIQEKSLLVSAIDEVYPELKLAERLNKAQYAMSPTLPLPPPRAAAWPGVREPAHMMTASQWASGPQPEPWRQIMAEIAQVIERSGPSPEPWKAQIMSEIASVISKYGYAMLNPQPLPPRMAAWPGVREPAHLMAPSQWASNPEPSPWRQAFFPGVREPAHLMAPSQWAYGPRPEPWRQAMAEIAQVLGRHGPTPEPWKDQLLSEIASVMGNYSSVMGDPVPWRQSAFPGVKEPAHPMMTHPWWSSDPAQMAAVQPQISQQMLSDMAAVMRKYGFRI
jgi:hypothetical protein